uniref:Uncharacterized protein n=1 Tax=Panagrolaimus davidi TaxID=227884 RepID=A0A914QDX9_9BILA
MKLSPGELNVREHIFQTPYQSLITTNNYGLSYCDEEALLITYVIENVTVKFTALEYKITAEMDFYFQKEGDDAQIR